MKMHGKNSLNILLTQQISQSSVLEADPPPNVSSLNLLSPPLLPPGRAQSTQEVLPAIQSLKSFLEFTLPGGNSPESQSFPLKLHDLKVYCRKIKLLRSSTS